MALAIEPMVNAGGPQVRMGDDGWAVYSRDGSLAAHFEFTVGDHRRGPPGAHAVASRRDLIRARIPAAFGAACYDSLLGLRADLYVLAAQLLGSPGLLSQIRTTARGDEGPSFRKTDVREVQGDPPWRGRARDLSEPAAQAEAGLAVARIAGVNIPLNKRVEVGLTYVFGIGRSTANKILQGGQDRPRHLRQGPDRGGGRQAPRGGRVARGRGRSSPRALSEHQAPPGDRLLPRACATVAASPCVASGPRPTPAARKGPKRMSIAGKRKARSEPDGSANGTAERGTAAASRRTSPSGRHTSRLPSTTRSSPSPTPRAT